MLAVVIINAVLLLSLLLHTMGGLLNLGSMPLDGLWERNVAEPGNPGLIGVNLICNEDIYIVSWHFFMVLLSNFMHVSYCSLL